MREHRLIPGGDFAHDLPVDATSVWGSGTEVLWPEGEPLVVAGPTSIGKTNLLHQLVLARAGLTKEVLDLPVAPAQGRVLYLALDRPLQIQRSWARIAKDTDVDLLNDRVTFWWGPLDFPLAGEPKGLLELAEDEDADTVMIDSLKDLGVTLKEEEGGAAVTAAWKHLVANDIDVASSQHLTKKSGKGSGIVDSYGSMGLTASAGSVVMLSGTPGQLTVKLRQVKAPLGELVGPWEVAIDPPSGSMTRLKKTSVYDIIAANNGTTVDQIALSVYYDDSRAAKERARRKAEALVEEGKVTKRTEEGASKYYLTIPLTPPVDD